MIVTANITLGNSHIKINSFGCYVTFSTTAARKAFKKKI